MDVSEGSTSIPLQRLLDHTTKRLRELTMFPILYRVLYFCYRCLTQLQEFLDLFFYEIITLVT